MTQNHNNPFLSIIIPAYNEAPRIVSTLNAIDEYLKEQTFSYEILVVDDGSKDNTIDVVLKASEKIDGLHVVANESNHGKGYVVKQGMLKARGEYRLFIDADHSTSISNLDTFLPLVTSQDHDVIISSRRIKGATIDIPQSKIRRLLGKTFTKLVQTVVPVGVADSQNGFKLFTASAAEKIFNQQQTFGWAFDVEILAIARLYNFKIKEVPISWTNDDRSRMKFRGMVGMLTQVFNVRVAIMNGEYGIYGGKYGDSRALTLSKFILFGALNTAVDWLWYLALTRSIPFFADHLLVSKVLAFMVGSIPVFIGNAYWVFPKHTPLSTGDHIKLYGILGCAFLINTFAFAQLVGVGVNDVTSIVIATSISFVWNLSLAWLLLIRMRVPKTKSMTAYGAL